MKHFKVMTTELLPKVSDDADPEANHTTREQLSQEKLEAIECAERIASRYAVEAEREPRPAYKANFARIAASYRQLAKDIAQ